MRSGQSQPQPGLVTRGWSGPSSQSEASTTPRPRLVFPNFDTGLVTRIIEEYQNIVPLGQRLSGDTGQLVNNTV